MGRLRVTPNATRLKNRECLLKRCLVCCAGPKSATGFKSSKECWSWWQGIWLWDSFLSNKWTTAEQNWGRLYLRSFAIFTYLLIYLINYLFNYLLNYLFTYLLNYLFTYLLNYLFTYLLKYLFIYLLTCLLTYLTTYLISYLFTCLPT